MPYSFTVDETLRLGIVVASAPNSFESTRDGILEFSEDPRLGPDFGIVLDLRENDYTPSATEAPELTTLYLERFRGRPLAMIVSRLVQLGVANMISTIAELRGGSVQAFRDRGEGEKWLAAEAARRTTGSATSGGRAS
ncbi:MAG TPA: hypothetical protein VJ826_07610 [Candidatus Polarisedimenticolaceae bacterium]|nr:hypothetical protein [Candidatus Polarisedimenticolaceae bacterium]